MPARISEEVRLRQLDELTGMHFIRWDCGYRNVHSKAVMKCDSGHEWSSSLNNLLGQMSGCPKCAGQYRYSAEERIGQLNNLEGLSFVRWDGEYQNQRSKAVMHCDTCSHDWSTSVHKLTQGRGCPSCAQSGYNPSEQGTLYALSSTCGTMVKIGITNDYKTRRVTLKRTTPFDWDCVEILHGDGALIAGLEKAFHLMTEQVKFTEPFDGYTEWRVWKPEITKWFSQWGELLNKETK